PTAGVSHPSFNETRSRGPSWRLPVYLAEPSASSEVPPVTASVSRGAASRYQRSESVRHHARHRDLDGHPYRTATHDLPANADRARGQPRKCCANRDRPRTDSSLLVAGGMVLDRGPGDRRALDLVPTISPRSSRIRGSSSLVAARHERIATRGFVLGCRRSGAVSDRLRIRANLSHIRDRGYVHRRGRAQCVAFPYPSCLSALGKLADGRPFLQPSHGSRQRARSH